MEKALCLAVMLILVIVGRLRLLLERGRRGMGERTTSLIGQIEKQ